MINTLIKALLDNKRLRYKQEMFCLEGFNIVIVYMDSMSNTKYLQQDGIVNLTLNNISFQFRVSLKRTDDKVLFVFPITLDL